MGGKKTHTDPRVVMEADLGAESTTADDSSASACDAQKAEPLDERPKSSRDASKTPPVETELDIVHESISSKAPPPFPEDKNTTTVDLLDCQLLKKNEPDAIADPSLVLIGTSPVLANFSQQEILDGASTESHRGDAEHAEPQTSAAIEFDAFVSATPVVHSEGGVVVVDAKPALPDTELIQLDDKPVAHTESTTEVDLDAVDIERNVGRGMDCQAPPSSSDMILQNMAVVPPTKLDLHETTEKDGTDAYPCLLSSAVSIEGTSKATEHEGLDPFQSLVCEALKNDIVHADFAKFDDVLACNNAAPAALFEGKKENSDESTTAIVSSLAWYQMPSVGTWLERRHIPGMDY